MFLGLVITPLWGHNQNCQKFGEAYDVYPCPNCNKVYHHKKTLSRHMRQECGVDPVLACPYCPYRARRAYVLAAHIKNHEAVTKLVQ